MTQNILFIGGSLNQTTMLHKIAQYMGDYKCYFTPYYADGVEGLVARTGWLDFSVLGGKHMRETKHYLSQNKFPVDYRGRQHNYDMVVTSSDLIVQWNIRGKRLVLVQEGITEPETWAYHAVKWLKLPRYLANTAASGLSDAYDVFCVASEGYAKHFIRKGVRREKLAVTGIPNFDHVHTYVENNFPYYGHILVATSPLRETFRRDDRISFLDKCREIAAGRPVIFKLHPMEKEKRAIREIEMHVPNSKVFTAGNVNHMIANAPVVITQQSTCTFVAVALGKEVHTNLNLNELRRLMPIQNNGVSSQKIATICRRLLHTPMPVLQQVRRGNRARPRWEQADSI